jgi:hypothetical protein
VILPDINLLIYGIDRDSSEHDTAREWFQAALSSGEKILLAWITIVGFLRITTRTGAFAQPLAAGSALNFVQGWLDHPAVSIAHPGPEHLRILRRLLNKAGTAGDLTSDAHLAALAIEHDAVLASADSDFARFPGLRWMNPLSRLK